jgi:hypothetical protein
MPSSRNTIGSCALQAAAFARRALDAAMKAGQADLAQQVRVRLRQYQDEVAARNSSPGLAA